MIITKMRKFKILVRQMARNDLDGLVAAIDKLSFLA